MAHAFAFRISVFSLALILVATTMAEADDANSQNPPDAQPAPEAPDEQPAEFRLEFHAQPWLEALQWFAEKSQLNLDWQKLPEGELNLSAQEPYTLPQIRDVLNMQLLVRGFTLLQRGDILRVVPLEGLDPTLVERVQAEELEKLAPHQFVRVSFLLDWMIAEEAARDLGPLLSPYGKLIPLAATNQLEAMDAVVNLREIQRLLMREQSDTGKKRLVEEFRLEHRRASDVAEMLRELLGLANPRYRRSSEQDRMQLELERTKLQSQAVEKLGDNASRFLQDKPDVNLVVNDEENSILVHAPPDKVEVIRQAITTLDRPSEKPDSAWENINRVKVYKVDDGDVESIEEMVSEMQDLGRLEAETRIQIDERNGAIIAYATAADHMTLAHLVRSFQQEPREAHVIQLSTLDPRYAAQAVRVLFNQGESEDDYWRRRRYGDSEDEAFRVEADQAHRRLLLWATATEHQRVTDYLKELGERATVAGLRQGVRVISTGAAEFSDIETKLRDMWGSISEVPLVIHANSAPSATTATGETQTGQPTETAEQDDAAADDAQRRATLPDAAPDIKASSDAHIRTASHLQIAANDEREECTADEHVVTVALAREEGGEEHEPSEATQAAEPPPVRVIAGPDGRLIVVSDDPAAAQLMTELLQSLLPEEKDVQVFPLKYASALSLEFQLQDLLNLDSDEEQEEQQSDPLGVSKPKLLIYSDGRTNRLLVRHASPEQLAVVRNLVSVLDQPEEVEPQLAREQWLYKVRNKDATELSETVKEVYRDLLSSSDKAFEGRDERSSRSAGYWGFASARSTVPEYQGLLSVGVDLSSNSLVVSAPQYLMTEVKQLVLSLDHQPSGQAISVMRLQNGTSGVVSQTLGQVLGESGQNGGRRWRDR
jgi:type II secretory pathway component GspD/PulD (secretin)